MQLCGSPLRPTWGPSEQMLLVEGSRAARNGSYGALKATPRLGMHSRQATEMRHQLLVRFSITFHGIPGWLFWYILSGRPWSCDWSVLPFSPLTIHQGKLHALLQKSNARSHSSVASFVRYPLASCQPSPQCQTFSFYDQALSSMTRLL